jgi:hypothetical protein
MDRLGRMDEENDPQPPFRWNRQAVFMACFFAVALAIPLGGVFWLALGDRKPQPVVKPAAEVDTTALKEGLERMSDAQFSGTVTVEVEKGIEIEVASEDMPARIARIAEIAKSAGGSAVDLSEPDAKSRRVMVQIASSRFELLKRAIRGESVDFSAIPAGTATQLLEVELKAP